MSLIGNIREITEIVQKADNIELYRKIMDMQLEAMELMDKFNQLKEENKELKERIATSGNLTFKDNLYYKDSEIDPYCTKCWDVDSKLVRLHGSGPLWFQCPSCKTVINNEDRTPTSYSQWT